MTTQSTQTSNKRGFNIRIEGNKNLVKKIRLPQNQPALRIFMGKTGADLEGKWKHGVRVDTGRYRNSIAHRIIDNLRGLPATLIQGRVKYAIHEEEGTRPHFPPVKALQPWASRHGFPGGRVGAFIVARKIAARGTEGSHAARNAVREATRTTIPRFVSQLARDIGIDWERN